MADNIISCGFCSKKIIDYDVHDITIQTQPQKGTDFILKPKVSRYISDKNNKNDNKNVFNYISNDKNNLITLGHISYKSELDLNDLIVNKNCKLNVKNISFGSIHSLMIIEIMNETDGQIIIKTKLYGIGSNENGQLGIDYNIEGNNSYEKEWVEIHLEEKIEPEVPGEKTEFIIEDVSTCDEFSLVTIKYPKDNKLDLYRFQLSKDDKIAILSGLKEFEKGNSSLKIFQNQVICVKSEDFYNSSGDNSGIRQVAAFGKRILVLTKNNCLYIKGISYDMTNISDYELYTKFHDNILYMTIGINNCLLLSEKNIIYAVGHNEYKEFGISEKSLNKNKNEKMNYRYSNSISSKSSYSSCCEEENTYFTNKFFKKMNCNILKISSGARHTMVLCDNGELYCFGDNSDGQCCGLEKIVEEPTLIEFEDEDEKIIDIKAGYNHSIAKGESGKVYVWGDSSWGKLGMSESRVVQYYPVEVCDMKIRNIISIFAGEMQSAFFASGDFIL